MLLNILSFITVEGVQAFFGWVSIFSLIIFTFMMFLGDFVGEADVDLDLDAEADGMGMSEFLSIRVVMSFILGLSVGIWLLLSSGYSLGIALVLALIIACFLSYCTVRLVRFLKSTERNANIDGTKIIGQFAKATCTITANKSAQGEISLYVDKTIYTEFAALNTGEEDITVGQEVYVEDFTNGIAYVSIVESNN